jgi:hypothetical protein
VGHPLQAGDAVVHGDQQLGPLLQRQVDDGRRQSVAMHRTVRHHVVQAVGRCAEQRQATQQHGASSGAVAVVVGHHAQAPALLHHVGQQPCRGIGTAQGQRRQQLSQAVVEFFGLAYAARSQQPCQQGMRTGLLERERAARRHVAEFQAGRAHSGSRTRRLSTRRHVCVSRCQVPLRTLS